MELKNIIIQISRKDDLHAVDARGVKTQNRWYSMRKADTKWLDGTAKRGAWIDPEMNAIAYFRDKTTDKLGVQGTKEFNRLNRRRLATNILRCIEGKRGNTDGLQAGVDDLLDRANNFVPGCLSVPQIPLDKDNRANSRRLNLNLATLGSKWMRTNAPKSARILPYHFLDSASYRTPALAKKCVSYLGKLLEQAETNNVWIYPLHLDDHLAQAKMQTEIGLFAELLEVVRTQLGSAHVVTGPFWFMQWVWFARGLADAYMVCPSKPFRYLAWSPPRRNPSIDHIVCPPLLRYLRANEQTAYWAEESAAEGTKLGNPAIESLADLKHTSLKTSVHHKRQADYMFARIEEELKLRKTPGSATMHYFQECTKALAVGSQLQHRIPATSLDYDSSLQRRPGAVAEQLLLQCLPR